MPEMPDWVHVWAWLRFGRNPQLMTPLPQQDEPDSMSHAEYTQHKLEWANAGKPKLTPQGLVAVMSGDDEVLPF